MKRAFINVMDISLNFRNTSKWRSKYLESVLFETTALPPWIWAQSSKAQLYLFKFNSVNMKTIVKICSNLAIKTTQSGVVFVDFEQIPHIIQVFPLLSLIISRKLIFVLASGVIFGDKSPKKRTLEIKISNSSK